MTVFDNVAYGPSIRKVPKDEIKRRVTEMLALVQMSGYESVSRMPCPAARSSASPLRGR